MNAEDGRPTGPLSELEVAAQEEWKADRRARVSSLNRLQANKRVVNHRPETEAKVERVALYGKSNPANGVCPSCHMLLPATKVCEECN